jgi:hypothetical protein
MLMLKNTKEDQMDGKNTTFMLKATLIPPRKTPCDGTTHGKGSYKEPRSRLRPNKKI